MSEEQKIQDDYPLGCMFPLLIAFAFVIVICLNDYRNGELTKTGLYALVGSTFFFLAVFIQVIVKIVKNIFKGSGGK